MDKKIPKFFFLILGKIIKGCLEFSFSVGLSHTSNKKLALGSEYYIEYCNFAWSVPSTIGKLIVLLSVNFKVNEKVKISGKWNEHSGRFDFWIFNEFTFSTSERK